MRSGVMDASRKENGIFNMRVYIENIFFKIQSKEWFLENSFIDTTGYWYSEQEFELYNKFSEKFKEPTELSDASNFLMSLKYCATAWVDKLIPEQNIKNDIYWCTEKIIDGKNYPEYFI